MCSVSHTVAIRIGCITSQIGGIIWHVYNGPPGPRFEVAQLRASEGDYHGCMDGPIIFTCPTTGQLVQHWLDRRDQALPNDHEMVVCPACVKIHFVNRQTGKLLGHKDQDVDS